MNHKTLVPALAVFALSALIACGHAGEAKKQDSTGASTATAAPVSNIPALDPKLQALLKHFKESTKFPYIVDSAYMSKVNKFDSLGGADVKLFAHNWFNDSLISDENHDMIMQDFYTIDSLKAKHAYEAWCKKLDIGMTKFATVYAIEQIKLKNDATLLVWALVTESYEADPNSARTSVYFTFWDGKTLGQTFILGEEDFFADPPQGAETKFYGTLSPDGHLTINQSHLQEDFDSAIGNLTTARTEFMISPNNIKRTMNFTGASKTIKIKE